MFATDFSKGGSSGSEGSSGEGDSAGGPIPERDGQAFPTLVIEAGYSQSLPSLRQKAHWWFDISNHDVKIVILAKLHLRQREITLERWEERQRGARAGATTTRHASAWVASCHQTITITESSANPQEYRVASGDLVLSFRLLFLRDPLPGEDDVVITVLMLQGYAQRVWAAFGNQSSSG